MFISVDVACIETQTKAVVQFFAPWPSLRLLSTLKLPFAYFSSLLSSSLLSCPPVGGIRRIWTKFDTPSFLAILRDPAGDPQSSWSIGWRLAGAKQYRLFTNTSWPAGASKRLGLGAEPFRALPVFVFSNKLHLTFSIPESMR